MEIAAIQAEVKSAFPAVVVHAATAKDQHGVETQYAAFTSGAATLYVSAEEADGLGLDKLKGLIAAKLGVRAEQPRTENH